MITISFMVYGGFLSRRGYPKFSQVIKPWFSNQIHGDLGIVIWRAPHILGYVKICEVLFWRNTRIDDWWWLKSVKSRVNQKMITRLYIEYPHMYLYNLIHKQLQSSHKMIYEGYTSLHMLEIVTIHTLGANLWAIMVSSYVLLGLALW